MLRKLVTAQRVAIALLAFGSWRLLAGISHFSPAVASIVVGVVMIGIAFCVAYVAGSE